jgi:Xaa-Pro aminopeptidase
VDYSKVFVNPDTREPKIIMKGEVERRHKALSQMLKALKLNVVLIERAKDNNERWITDSSSVGGSSVGLFIFPAEGIPMVTQGYRLVEEGPSEGFDQNKMTIVTPSNEIYGSISAVDLKFFMGDSKRLGETYPGEMVADLHNYLKRKLLDVELVDLTDELNALAAVKSEAEMEAFEMVVQEHEVVFKAVDAMLRIGRLEREIVNEVRWQAYKHGCSGSNMVDSARVEMISNPQNQPIPAEDLNYPGRRLQASDCVSIRMQAKGCNGYYGAIGRCWVIGDPSAETIKRWNDAVAAQDFVASKIVPGTTLRDIAAKTEAYLKKRGYAAPGGAYIHSIGYAAISGPCVNGRGKDTPLYEGMVLSVHPGIYKNRSDFVFTCDDLYHVTKNGAIRLSKLNRDLVVL